MDSPYLFIEKAAPVCFCFLYWSRLDHQLKVVLCEVSCILTLLLNSVSVLQTNQITVKPVLSGHPRGML